MEGIIGVPVTSVNMKLIINFDKVGGFVEECRSLKSASKYAAIDTLFDALSKCKQKNAAFYAAIDALFNAFFTSKGNLNPDVLQYRAEISGETIYDKRKKITGSFSYCFCDSCTDDYFYEKFPVQGRCRHI